MDVSRSVAAERDYHVSTRDASDVKGPRTSHHFLNCENRRPMDHEQTGRKKR